MSSKGYEDEGTLPSKVIFNEEEPTEANGEPLAFEAEVIEGSEGIESIDGVDGNEGIIGNVNASRATPSNGKFPCDCYSFIALNRPMESRQTMGFFFFGLLPFLFQMVFLLILLWSVMDYERGTIGDTDNPDAEEGFFSRFIPANASPIVRGTQVLSMIAFLIFQDASLQDVVQSIQMFPSSSEVQDGDPVGCMRLSCVLKGIQGILSVFCAMILVFISDTVIDIILNFTAVNFISYFDQNLFSLALSADLGPGLQTEAKRIKNKDLPPCIFKTKKHFYYRTVLASMSSFIFAFVVFVIYIQTSQNNWTTKTMRVEFQESTGLKAYSGCFELNGDRKSMSSFRYSYKNQNGPTNSSFVYCRQNRQWILFKGNSTKLCDTNDNTDRLAKSPKTDTFDISTSFDESWVSSTNTPLDMYFFESGNDNELYCDSILGDGNCDQVLNALGYDFDGGDCCAATCAQSICGRQQLKTVFGNSSYAEISFPYCEDETMVPITIQLNDIKSSRAFESSLYGMTGDESNWEDNRLDLTEWKLKPPEKSYFSIECDNQNVLTVYIDNTMVNNSETVWVNDGANCIVTAGNFSNYNGQLVFDDRETVDDDAFQRVTNIIPGWLIDYTIFHGEKDDDNKLEILSQRSWEQETSTFKRMPECYLRKLGSYTDVASIYKGIGQPDEVVEWLVEIDTDNSMCENEDKFDERYKISRVFYAFNLETFTKRENQCTWPEIICDQGQVDVIELVGKNISGSIPNEIYWINNLTKIRLDLNQLTSLPSEIGNLSSLSVLSLDKNELTSLPSEIGNLSSLSVLRLDDNELTSLPSEIGNLSSLSVLSLDDMRLTSLPSEIGNLSSLSVLRLGYNEFSSILSEIGKLSSLSVLRLYGNELTSLPSEIGNLSNLSDLYLDDMRLTSLPSELGNLSSLSILSLDKNELTSLPSEIGNLSSLSVLSLGDNELTSLPSEIGNLSSLSVLSFYGNNINATEVPEGVVVLCRKAEVECETDFSGAGIDDGSSGSGSVDVSSDAGSDDGSADAGSDGVSADADDGIDDGSSDSGSVDVSSDAGIDNADADADADADDGIDDGSSDSGSVDVSSIFML